MRAVVQRVLSSSVSIGGEVTASIEKGLMVLIGVEVGDTEKDARYIADKCVGLRIFDDENGVPNLAVGDVGGSILAQVPTASQTQTSYPRPPNPLPLSLHFQVSFGNEPGLGALSRLSDSDTLGAQEFSPWVKESQGSVIYKRESGEISYFPNIMGLVKELRAQP